MTPAVVILAREPEPGHAKTRLIPALGAEGAAQLHARLVRRTVLMAKAAGVGPVELRVTSDTDHPWLAALARELALPLVPQGPGDLGARMLRAMEARAPALLIGTDCPVLEPRHLREASEALAHGSDVVLGPAEDGGYTLIGMARAEASLFRDMPWGTDAVLGETRARLIAAGLSCTALETLWDVDRPDDLARLHRLDAALLAPA